MSKRALIFSNNYLLAEGIRSLINKDFKDFSILITEKIEYNEDKSLFALVVDKNVLSDPGVYSLERIKKHYRKAKIVLLSKGEPSEELQPYLDSCILYSDSKELIQEKISKVFKDSADKNFQSNTNSLLSERENEVLRYVALGFTNRDMSRKLSISAHTVITHRKNITAKLGIKTIAGLTIYAVINGIISMEEMNS